MQNISQLVWLRHNLSEQKAETGTDPDALVSGVNFLQALALCFAQHSQHRPE